MEFVEKLFVYVQTASVADVIDILIVAFLIYKVMTLLRDLMETPVDDRIWDAPAP